MQEVLISTVCVLLIAKNYETMMRAYHCVFVSFLQRPRQLYLKIITAAPTLFEY